MTRAMVVTVLHRAAVGAAVGTDAASGLASPFADVSQGAYYYEPVLWASAHGIVVGVGGGLFDPGALITREQLATIIHRFAASQGTPFAPLPDGLSSDGALPAALSEVFIDAGMIAAYAREPVYALARSGVLMGDETGRANPQGAATRAQAAAVLRRFIEAAKG